MSKTQLFIVTELGEKILSPFKNKKKSFTTSVRPGQGTIQEQKRSPSQHPCVQVRVQSKNKKNEVLHNILAFRLGYTPRIKNKSSNTSLLKAILSPRVQIHCPPIPRFGQPWCFRQLVRQFTLAFNRKNEENSKSLPLYSHLTLTQDFSDFVIKTYTI